MRIRITTILILIFFAFSCKHPVQHNASCMENPGQGRLFVFVGEKLDIIKKTDEVGIMDAKFLVRYKILEKACGDYNKDEIEFIVYDHYGIPAFSNFKVALLFVKEENGIFYHEKYMYEPLFKTKNGHWAGPLSDEYRFNSNTAIKPVKIDFVDEVSFSIEGLKKREIKAWFPEPFFRIQGNKAISVFGNYVPELVELRKNGVLKARGLFGGQDTKLQPQEVRLEESEPISISINERTALSKIWQQLLEGIKTKNSKTIRDLSLDNVVCAVCEGFARPDFYNDVEPIDSFVTTIYKYLPATKLWESILHGSYEMEAIKYPDRKPAHIILSGSESLVIYSIIFQIVDEFSSYKYEQYHEFQFVKQNGQFKFYGMKSN